LTEIPRCGDRTNTRTQLQAGWQLGLLAGGRPGLSQVLVQQVLEHHPAALEPVGGRVRQVVRDGIQLSLLGFETGFRNGQRSHHGNFS